MLSKHISLNKKSDAQGYGFTIFSVLLLGIFCYTPNRDFRPWFTCPPVADKPQLAEGLFINQNVFSDNALSFAVFLPKHCRYI